MTYEFQDAFFCFIFIEAVVYYFKLLEWNGIIIIISKGM